MKGSCERGQQVDQNYITGYFEKKNKKNQEKCSILGPKIMCHNCGFTLRMLLKLLHNEAN